MLPLSENELDDLVARERARGAPPLTSWHSIAAQLRAEGLLKQSTLGSRLSPRVLMQAAAALLLVAGGAALGRSTARAPSSSAATTATTTNEATDNATLTSASAAAPDFKSSEEAWATLNKAGEDYQRASAYLSATNTEVPLPTNPDTYRTRLAALDGVVSQMGKALQQAPHDPVINQYYMATVGAREATLRQLGTTLPAGMKLNRF